MEPIALRLRQREEKEREIERRREGGRGEAGSERVIALQQDLMASLERGVRGQGRRRHNEEAVTEAEIDSERWMEGETKGGGGYAAAG